jgi:hypothetical protein
MACKVFWLATNEPPPPPCLVFIPGRKTFVKTLKVAFLIITVSLTAECQRLQCQLAPPLEA